MTNKLAPRQVTSAGPGRHSDGGGLFLVVDSSGARRWEFEFRWKPHRGVKGAGRQRQMGLGSFQSVSLAEARKAAEEARKLVHSGIDPVANRRAALAVQSFGAMADEMIANRGSELRSDKSLVRWKRSLQLPEMENGERVGRKLPPASAKVEAQRIDALRTLRELPVNAVATEDVLRLLQPIWAAKPETAQKTRGYVEAVLDAAKAKGQRSGENPARWRGHLDHLLARPQKLSRGHHAALDFADVPAFAAELRTRDAVAALGLEFLILTAARTGEVTGATWSEVDLGARVWTVPASRMKAGREHRVPLSARAVEILEKVKPLRVEGDFVFPGGKVGSPLSAMGFNMLLRRMERTGITVHGFRSSFRDWAGEATGFAREVAEAALAHTVGDAAELAYRRADALEKRRKLMDAWARYCSATPKGNNVKEFPKVARR